MWPRAAKSGWNPAPLTLESSSTDSWTRSTLASSPRVAARLYGFLTLERECLGMTGYPERTATRHRHELRRSPRPVGCARQLGLRRQRDAERGIEAVEPVLDHRPVRQEGEVPGGAKTTPAPGAWKENSMPVSVEVPVAR